MRRNDEVKQQQAHVRKLAEAIDSLERLKYARDALVHQVVHEGNLELVTEAARRELERLARGWGVKL